MSLAPASDAASFAQRHRSARARLGTAQKGKAGVPAYLRFINRRLGGEIAALGHALGRTPNQLTAISALWSVAGIAVLALARPTPLIGVAVAIALLVGYAFDSADGQLARLRGGGGPEGEWLDHVVDIAKTSTLHAAVAVSWFRYPGVDGDAWLLVPLAFGIVAVTFFFGMMLRDQLGGKPPTTAADGQDGLIKSLALLPMDYGVLCLCFAVHGFPPAFPVGYSALLALNAAFALRSLAKARRLLGAV